MATRSPQAKQEQEQEQEQEQAVVVAALLSERHIDGVRYRAGQLVRMATDKAKPYISDGTFDADAEAVAYRKSQGAEVLDHVPAVTTAEAEVEPAADKAAAESN